MGVDEGGGENAVALAVGIGPDRLAAQHIHYISMPHSNTTVVVQDAQSGGLGTDIESDVVPIRCVELPVNIDGILHPSAKRPFSLVLQDFVDGGKETTLFKKLAIDLLEGSRHDQNTASVSRVEMGLWKGITERENERR